MLNSLLDYPPAMAAFLSAMLLLIAIQANVVRSRLALAGIILAGVMVAVGLFDARAWPFWGASIALLSPMLFEVVVLVLSSRSVNQR